MKKILLAALIIVLSFSLVACGGTNLTPADNSTNTQAESVESVSGTETKIEWEEFLAEYEEFVDDYIELVKKYKNNPTDMSILSDYTDMMSDVSEWSTKTADMQKELEAASPSEVAKYTKKLAKIAAKLAKAAY